MEMGRGFDAQDERRLAPGGQLQRPLVVSERHNRAVGARGEAETTPGTGFVDDPDAVRVHRHGIRGADSHARQTRDAMIRFDAKVHLDGPGLGGDGLTAFRFKGAAKMQVVRGAVNGA
jgi:hypothetical protein